MSLREFERLLSALLDADRESELLGQAPGCSPAEAEQARRKWLDALGALMNEVSALAAERGEGGEREAIRREVIDALAAEFEALSPDPLAILAAKTVRAMAAPAPSAPPRAPQVPWVSQEWANEKCASCVHDSKPFDSEPCVSCDWVAGFTMWQPKSPAPRAPGDET